MSTAAHEPIERALSRLPATLKPQVLDWLADFQVISALPDSELCLQSLPAVWSSSPFIARYCLRHPDAFIELANRGALEVVAEPGTLTQRLDAALTGVTTVDALDSALRRFRHIEMLRIGWRDLAGWAGLGETLQQLSELADACIEQALRHHHRWLQERHGTPRDRSGNPQQLYVIGMGKLGGLELNFSSDIDLIFGFEHDGETDGDRPLDNHRYFTRLGQRLIGTLNARLAEGFVFRVDMRLRPFGDAGALVMTSEQLEHYYETQGREWERYAMIKARIVAGDQAAGERLLAALRPFVFRRYLDFGALEQLRDMKVMIETEVERRGLRDNIKLGAGGIREVEFVGQAFQLIRGGRERGLQARGIVTVLTHLGREGILPGYAVRELLEGYEFLRRSENRLQAAEDKQVHTLPGTPLERQRLAYSMGFERWGDFLDRLDDWRQRVRSHFDRVFAAPQTETAVPEQDGPRYHALWAGELDQDAALAVLDNAGFTPADDAWRRLRSVHDGPHYRALSDHGRSRLDRLMPLLLGAASMVDHPVEALTRLLDLLEAIVRRSTYVALLAEHPMALSQLVKLCAASPWVARQLRSHPLLLDELLDPRTLYAPLRRQALQEELRKRLDAHPGDDLEQRMEILRQFKQSNTLRVAAADLSGVAPLMRVSDHLTDVAEVVLDEVLVLAREHLERRHGRPFCTVDGDRREARFCIIAYGKLGGIELGYGSDLDLVFLHDSQGTDQLTDGARPVDNAVFFMRLVQRIIHILGAAMGGGILYEVDTRLRPSGRAGLLASSLAAYQDYQRTQAWTWEHQALVRARPVAGDPQLAEAFQQVRNAQLAKRREIDPLRQEVCAMRQRMFEAKAAQQDGLFDLKQSRGGIADIEFMVQYGVLALAHQHPRLLRYTDNVRLLFELTDIGWLNGNQAAALVEAYRFYRGHVHHATLQERAPLLDPGDCREWMETVQRIWRDRMEDNSDNSPGGPRT